MSFSLEDGLPIAIVEDGPADGEIVFVKKDDKTGKKEFKLRKGKFQQLPNDLIRIIYIAAPAGCGKSTYCALYARTYQYLYPENPIILFSRLDEDPAFDGIKLERVVINNDMIEVPLQIEEAGTNALLIFDDLDTISSKKLLKSIYNFERQVLELGRHKKLQMLITSHLINGLDKDLCKTIHNELDTLTIFPGSGSVHQIHYNLEEYWGLGKKQIRNILNTDTRWVTLFKKHPQLVLTENKICFLADLDPTR